MYLKEIDNLFSIKNTNMQVYYKFVYCNVRIFFFYNINNFYINFSGETTLSYPITQENLDQSLNREQKLALYDYVIANSPRQNSYRELYNV